MSIWHIAFSIALSYEKSHRKKINTLNIVYEEKKQGSNEIPGKIMKFGNRYLMTWLAHRPGRGYLPGRCAFSPCYCMPSDQASFTESV